MRLASRDLILRRMTTMAPWLLTNIAASSPPPVHLR